MKLFSYKLLEFSTNYDIIKRKNKRGLPGMNRGFLIFANEDLNVDMHINCWRCFKEENKVLIDCGIMLKQTSAFKSLVLYFPFDFTIDDLECIGKKTIEDCKLIFNADLTTTNNGKTEYYTKVQEENGSEWGAYSFRISCILNAVRLKMKRELFWN